jgi:hypothetical protein
MAKENRTRIRTLENNVDGADKLCIFKRVDDDGRVVAIWARSDGAALLPPDQTFDPPVERCALPPEWQALLALSRSTTRIDLSGIFADQSTDV